MWTKLTLSMAKVLNVVTPITNVLKGGEDTTGGTTKPSTGGTTITATKAKSVMEVASKLELVLKKILGPIFTILGLIAVGYAIYLGVQYARAEDATKRKEIQGRLIGACIGAVIIIAGATLCFAINWPRLYHSFAVGEDTTAGGHPWVDTNKDGFCDTCYNAQ